MARYNRVVSEVATISPPEHALCLGCNYPLRGLMSHRCPECGREFDASDCWTMNTGRPMGRFMRWWLQPAGMILYSWAGATAVLYFAVRTMMAHGRPTLWDELQALPNFFWGALLIVWVIRSIMRSWIVRRYRQPRQMLLTDRPARKFTCVTFLAVMLVTNLWIGTDRCPHATYVGFAGFGGIAHSNPGTSDGPCFNHARAKWKLFGEWYIYIAHDTFAGEVLNKLGIR